MDQEREKSRSLDGACPDRPVLQRVAEKYGKPYCYRYGGKLLFQVVFLTRGLEMRGVVEYMLGSFHLMLLPESAIEFGPFKTAHHRTIVDRRFRDSFLDFLRSEVVPKVEGSPFSITGRLYSHYDEERYFGPNSAVKCRYAFEVVFKSEEGEEKAKGEFDYDPTANIIRPVRRSVSVDSLSCQKMRVRAWECASGILQRYRQGERHFVCPECGGPLNIWFLETRNMIKDISCAEGCIRMHFD